MSQDALDRFLQTVLQDAALQEQLWTAAEPVAFMDLVQHLGAKYGHCITPEDLKARLYLSRRAWREDAALTTAKTALDGWIPIRLERRGGQTMVEWCYLGGRGFVEPFFDQTVAACLRHPFNRLVRQQTPIDALGELHRTQPSLPATGFIFHMSRCGSTLIAQLLASLQQAIVVAEAEPIDAVLRAHLRDPAVSDEQRRTWLQWVIGALGRRRDPRQHYLFVKFDSWSILDLPLIRRAFPAVPWLFVYRDPVEILVSHAKMRGSQMVPGVLEPTLLGLEEAEIRQMPLDEYCARTLAIFGDAAAGYSAGNEGRLINYRELPAVVWSSLLAFFGVRHTDADIERMRYVAQFHAKSPSTRFSGDILAKQQAATDDLRRLADLWLGQRHRRLLELQREQDAQGWMR